MSEQRYFRMPHGRIYSIGGEGRYHSEGSIRGVSDVPVQVVPLDAIVIRREELPEVHDPGHGELHAGGIAWGRSFDHRKRALTHLALSEHQESPMDEEQVKALNRAYSAWWQRGDEVGSFGRYAYERGVRVVDEP